MKWGFYGRGPEREKLRSILSRNRWFFLRLTGRRRIGKTTLVHEVLRELRRERVFYMQVPDSGPSGVLDQAAEFLQTFHIPDSFERPTSLLALAKLITQLVEAGYIVALDEFQYFVREQLRPFTSFLQAEIDALNARAANVRGGLIVLGSIQSEMTTLLDHRSAPLFNRVTDDVVLSHLDIQSVAEILREHGVATPEHLLFIWNIFEGVPKFYRDAYEQNALGMERGNFLKALFFDSSAPLRSEADNWFLKELQGRYDVILQFIARHPGCTHADIVEHVRVYSQNNDQVGNYLRTLERHYGLIERKLPIFSKPTARQGRYHITDNFLRTWLGALATPSRSLAFRRVEDVIADADSRLKTLEGGALEKLVRQLYAERSRRGQDSFTLSEVVRGYWNRKDADIDLVALSESSQTVRFGSCKRDPAALLDSLSALKKSAQAFFAAFPKFKHWNLEYTAIAPRLGAADREQLEKQGVLTEDFAQLGAFASQ